MRARTEENAAVLDEVVLSQEDQQQIYHFTSKTESLLSNGSFFSAWSWFERTPTADLTEEIRCARPAAAQNTYRMLLASFDSLFTIATLTE